MKILHYALGFAPYRSGGLTAYVTDVMTRQREEGHQTAMLWPGRMRPGGLGRPRIRSGICGGFVSHELVDPLPVPLLEGVRDIPAYTKCCDKRIFLAFLRKEAPEIIHIHTFMGLYRELIQAAVELGIPLVYTTHDYYPLCPKVSLICGTQECVLGMASGNCAWCSLRALSLPAVMALQSPLYRAVKQSPLFAALRARFRKGRQQAEEAGERESGRGAARPEPAEKGGYQALQRYYGDMLAGISLILCNSEIAMERYRSLGQTRRMTLLPLTNGRIRDRRAGKDYRQGDVLKLGYLGAATQAKGFFLLRDVLDELERIRPGAFRLDVYTPVAQTRGYLRVHEPYRDAAGMDAAYETMDVLIVPSLWRETFGFVVPEALSYGTPVVVTESVGAGCLIRDGENGRRIPGSRAALRETILSFLDDRGILRRMNRHILEGGFPFSMEEHSRRLTECYRAAGEGTEP